MQPNHSRLRTTFVLITVALALSGGLGGALPGTSTVGSAAHPGNARFGALSSPLYNLTFSETGLAAGTLWNVTVNGTWQNSTGSSIAFLEPNGTYAWSVNPIAGYTSAWSGSATVSGADVGVPVDFTVVTYALTFQESGLPSATNWSVTLGASTLVSNTSSIAFTEPNGTFSYKVGPEAGYTTSWSGHAVVNGAAATITVAFSLTLYALTFGETGLPSATNWSVTVGGSTLVSNTSSIAFQEPNGTYAYKVGALAGYTTNWTGSVTLSAAAASVAVTFVQVTYDLTFTEHGLPSGTKWTVTIGATASSSTTTSLVVQEPNGTYNYAITPIAGYTTSWTGSATVNGMAQGVSLSFVQVTYTLGFSESGLPSGTSWTVTIEGSYLSSSTSSIDFTEPNGTYSYAITPVAGYSTTWKGSATVDGGPATVDVEFSQVTYGLEFVETGLPASSSWTVTVDTVSVSSSTESLGFVEPNGTFAWAVTPIAGYTTTWTGNVTLSAGPATVEIGFTQVTYALAFSERRLPAGTNWTVTVSGVGSQTSASGEISFTEPNGSYDWAVGALGGYTASSYTGTVVVNGSNVIVDVTFARFTYPVAFQESGLPSGTTWAVTIGTSSVATRNASFVQAEANGSFAYSILAVPGYTTAWTGVFTVAGTPVTVSIDFQPVLYAVTFTETGLPEGSNWTVTLAGVPGSSAAMTIVSQIANGSYAYSVAPIPGYTTEWTGTVVVDGAARSVSIAFRPFTFALTFLALGLPDGTAWSVSVDGQSLGSTVSSLEFAEANGTYPYTVAGVPGYATALLGSVAVRGASATVTLRFVPVTYAVTFTETGLPASASWAVAIGPTSARGPSPSLALAEPNGSYAYDVFPVAGYRTTYTGTVVVSGTGPMVSVTFAMVTYALTFQESGLPTGTNWSVTLQVVGPGAIAPGGSSATLWSDGAAAVTFQVANGTYSYSTSAAGYLTVASTVAVGGASPPAVATPMVQPGSGSSGNGNGWMLWAGALAVLIVVALALLVAWGRRRPPAPAHAVPPAEPEAEAPTEEP
jgi:hypothetical protein